MNRTPSCPDNGNKSMPLCGSGGGDCPKSQTFLSENQKSASGLVGVRGISVSRGLFVRPGGGALCMADISLTLSQGFSTLHDIDAFRCSVAEISDNLAGCKRVI